MIFLEAFTLGTACRSNFSTVTKSRFLLSHWTPSLQIPVYPQIPFHKRYLCKFSCLIIRKSLQGNITWERSRDSVAAVTGRDMGSYQHQKDYDSTPKVFGSSQHRFMKGNWGLTVWHNLMSGLAGEDRALDVVHLEFRWAFNIASYNLPLRQAGEV